MLDRVLDLEERLVELRLVVLLLLLSGEGYTKQGFKQFSVEPLNLGSDRSLLLYDLKSGLDELKLSVVVEITEDCLENCPMLDKAATSKAEAVDLSEVFADVSTYITAPHCFDIASACSEDMVAFLAEWTDLMSDLQPTNTIGVEGDIAVKVGIQYVTAAYRDDREDIEKQRRKTSAVARLSLCSLSKILSLVVS